MILHKLCTFVFVATILFRQQFFFCFVSEEQRLRNLENRATRETFVHKRVEVTGKRRQLQSDDLNGLC
jgi:hypothetical protein